MFATEISTLPPGVRDAASGYDEIASVYDSWRWQEFWNRNEVPLVLSSARALAPSARVGLDIGTGTGKYLTRIEDLGLRGSAVDVSSGMLNCLAAKRGADSLLFQADAVDIPLPTNCVDVAFLCRVLSHVQRVNDVIREAARVVRPGAFLFITDVDAEHSYSHTRIPSCSGENVFIRTWKHSLSDIEAIVRSSRVWTKVSSHAFKYPELLWRPMQNEFPSIDATGARAVFYTLVLQRR